MPTGIISQRRGRGYLAPGVVERGDEPPAPPLHAPLEPLGPQTPHGANHAPPHAGLPSLDCTLVGRRSEGSGPRDPLEISFEPVSDPFQIRFRSHPIAFICLYYITLYYKRLY
eukprot:1195498-Prorocentrum_minimum.AAC.1